MWPAPKAEPVFKLRNDNRHRAPGQPASLADRGVALVARGPRRSWARGGSWIIRLPNGPDDAAGLERPTPDTRRAEWLRRAILATPSTPSRKARFSKAAARPIADSIGSDRPAAAPGRSSRRAGRSCAWTDPLDKSCRRQRPLEAAHAIGGRTRPRGIRVSPARGSHLERSSTVGAKCAVPTPAPHPHGHCRERRREWHNWFERASRCKRRRASICLSPRG